MSRMYTMPKFIYAMRGGPGATHMNSVHLASELKGYVPELKGFPTGVDGLDNLFFVAVFNKEGQPELQPLGGYPQGCVVHVTGIPDTGKSIMAEQFALKQASMGNTTCIVTVEQPAQFLLSSLKLRAAGMKLKFDELEDRIVLVDAAQNSVLRDDLSCLIDTLARVIKKYGVKVVVIDSVTGLYEAREMLARQTVRALYNFMKMWHQTAIFVSQKRSGHEELTAEAAGGYAISHIVDCSIVLSKKEILNRYDQSLYGLPPGEQVRLLRIDGCRMCGHDTRVHVMEIDEWGLVKVGSALQEFIQKRNGNV